MATEAERLALLYELNRRLATFTDLDELVGYATRRAHELFKADGCALLLIDRSRRELYFPVASQREGHTSGEPLSEIRFAAELGIAGWVLGRDEGVIVDDARNDPRFYTGVDKRTGLVTRTVLCAPLRTRPIVREAPRRRSGRA